VLLGLQVQYYTMLIMLIVLRTQLNPKA